MLEFGRVSSKSLQGRQYYSFYVIWDNIYACTLKTCEVLTIKNALVKTSCCVAVCTICGLLFAFKSTVVLGDLLPLLCWVAEGVGELNRQEFHIINQSRVYSPTFMGLEE